MSDAALRTLCAWLDGGAKPQLLCASLPSRDHRALVASLQAAGVLVATRWRGVLPCSVGRLDCGLEVLPDERERPDGSSRSRARCPEADGCRSRDVADEEIEALEVVPDLFGRWLRTQLALDGRIEPSHAGGFQRLGSRGRGDHEEHIYLVRAVSEPRQLAELVRVTGESGDDRTLVIVVDPAGLSPAARQLAGRLQVRVLTLAELLTVDGERFRARFSGAAEAIARAREPIAEVFTNETGRKARLFDADELAALRAQAGACDLFIDELEQRVVRSGQIQLGRVPAPAWTMFRRALDRVSRFEPVDLLGDDDNRDGARRFQEARRLLDLQVSSRMYAILPTIKDAGTTYYVAAFPQDVRFALIFRLGDR